MTLTRRDLHAVALYDVALHAVVLHGVVLLYGVRVVAVTVLSCPANLCAQVFRYLSISKNMNSLWLTLSRATKDLVAFGFGCVLSRRAVDVVVLSAAPYRCRPRHLADCGGRLLSDQVLGHRLRLRAAEQLRVRPRARGLPERLVGVLDAASLPTGRLRLPQAWAGAFLPGVCVHAAALWRGARAARVCVLVQTRPELAAIFFSIYVGMVFIVCINMFIGIITKYFEEVRSRGSGTCGGTLPLLRPPNSVDRD